MILQDARVIVNGIDLSADHSEIEYEVGRAELDTSCFGHTAECVVAGLATITLTGNGYVRLPGTDLIRRSLGLERVPITLMADPSDPDAAVESFLGMVVKFTAGAQAGQLLAFSWDAKSQGVMPVYGGATLAQSLTVDGASAAQELGGLDAGEAYVVTVHVLGVVGTTPALMLTVESDDDGLMPAPSTRATVGPLTDVGAAMQRIAGPIVSDVWWRVTWAITGTGSPAFDVVIVLGREG